VSSPPATASDWAEAGRDRNLHFLKLTDSGLQYIYAQLFITAEQNFFTAQIAGGIIFE